MLDNYRKQNFEQINHQNFNNKKTHLLKYKTLEVATHCQNRMLSYLNYLFLKA